MKVYLVFHEGTSDKFWSAEADGTTLTVVFGRRGTQGTTKTKTFATAEACLAEAQKLAKQKRSKGYADEGSGDDGTQPSPQAPKAKNEKMAKRGAATSDDADAPEAPRALRRPPPPSEFATQKRHPDFETFDPADLELFHLGFPELVLLDDAHPHDKNPRQIERWAKTALDACDPVYTTVWPTQVALAYAHAFPIVARKEPERFAERMATFRKDPTPTPDTVRTLLREFMPGNDVYSGWRAPAALYALEHFLGAETIATVIVECLAELRSQDLSKGYSHVRIVLEALGYLMLRMSEPARAGVRKAIDEVISKGEPDLLSAHLALLPDGALEMTPEEYGGELGPWFMSSLSVSSWQRWKSFDRSGPSYLDVRALYLDGPSRLRDADFRLWLDGISKRRMLASLDTFGRVKDPGAVRMMLALGKFKSMNQELSAWLKRNEEYVQSVLPQLGDDAYVKQGLATLHGNTPAIKKAKDPMAATQKLMAQLEKKLPKAFPKQDQVTALVREAADHARELARLDGQDYPEVYFVELWAEFPFSLKVSDEDYELLRNAYTEVIEEGQ